MMQSGVSFLHNLVAFGDSIPAHVCFHFENVSCVYIHKLTMTTINIEWGQSVVPY